MPDSFITASVTKAPRSARQNEMNDRVIILVLLFPLLLFTNKISMTKSITDSIRIDKKVSKRMFSTKHPRLWGLGFEPKMWHKTI